MRHLPEHLSTQLPYSFRITVVDNASTDATFDEAAALTRELDRLRVVHLTHKGRGRGLGRVVALGRRVLAYLDVDLSTDLSGAPRLRSAFP